ncbi:unnamed protein product, partial [Closterium sp. NIES-53]
RGGKRRGQEKGEEGFTGSIGQPPAEWGDGAQHGFALHAHSDAGRTQDNSLQPHHGAFCSLPSSLLRIPLPLPSLLLAPFDPRTPHSFTRCGFKQSGNLVSGNHLVDGVMGLNMGALSMLTQMQAARKTNGVFAASSWLPKSLPSLPFFSLLCPAPPFFSLLCPAPPFFSLLCPAPPFFSPPSPFSPRPSRTLPYQVWLQAVRQPGIGQPSSRWGDGAQHGGALHAHSDAGGPQHHCLLLHHGSFFSPFVSPALPLPPTLPLPPLPPPALSPPPLGPHCYTRCGFKQSGNLVSGNHLVDGVMGLNMGALSMLSQMQAARKTNGVFAHCLGGEELGGGSLIFGTVLEDGLLYTSLLDDRSHYYVQLNGISVGGQRLPGIDQSSFSSQQDVFGGSGSLQAGGVIIDSGTTLAMFPTPIYNTWLDAVTSLITLPQVGATSDFLCYDFGSNKYEELSKYFPTVTLHFEGADMTVEPPGYVFLHSNVSKHATLGNLPSPHFLHSNVSPVQYAIPPPRHPALMVCF